MYEDLLKTITYFLVYRLHSPPEQHILEVAPYKPSHAYRQVEWSHRKERLKIIPLHLKKSFAAKQALYLSL